MQIVRSHANASKWTYAQVQDFVREFRAVIKDRKNHYYHEVRCVYGRKPLPEEVFKQESISAQPLVSQTEQQTQ